MNLSCLELSHFSLPILLSVFHQTVRSSIALLSRHCPRVTPGLTGAPWWRSARADH